MRSPASSHHEKTLPKPETFVMEFLGVGSSKFLFLKSECQDHRLLCWNGLFPTCECGLVLLCSAHFITCEIRVTQQQAKWKGCIDPKRALFGSLPGFDLSLTAGT